MRALKWLIAIPLPLIGIAIGVVLGGLIIVIVDPLLETFIQDQVIIVIMQLAVEFVFGSGGLMFGIFLAVRLLEPPKDPNACEECGYNLTGNVSGRCPECGTEISSV